MELNNSVGMKSLKHKIAKKYPEAEGRIIQLSAFLYPE